VDTLVVEVSSLVFNSDMSKAMRRFFSASLVLALTGSAFSDPLIYQRAFTQEVYEFANLNRLNISRLHRDVHADCFILVTIATVILSDGSVKGVSVVKSSSVPVVDRYFRYIIEQAAPFQPLANHYDPIPEEITVTQEFRLDVMLWTDGISATRPCDELEPRGSQPD
jgi:hypothetical protein